MWIVRVLLLLLACAGAVAGQGSNPAQKSNLKPSDLCTVDGVVVKSTTGEGIKRVTVQLIPLGGGQQSYSAFTENNGRFVVRDIAPGRYAIYASGNGYVEQAAENGKPGSQTRILNLSPGENTSGLAFRLVPPGVITGTVYDEDGEPVMLAQVRAMRVTGSGARRPAGESGSQQTNDLGEYRIWGLQRGKYLVAATYRAPESGQPQPTDQVYCPPFTPAHPMPRRPPWLMFSLVRNLRRPRGPQTGARRRGARARHGGCPDENKGDFRFARTAQRRRKLFRLKFRQLRQPRARQRRQFEIRGVPPGPYNVVGLLE